MTFLRRQCRATVEATESADEAHRALADAKNVNGRAQKLNEQLTETLRRNHFGAAVVTAMRGVGDA